MPIQNTNSTDRENREAVIQSLIDVATANPLVDSNNMVALFAKYTIEVIVFERTGTNLLAAAFQKEIDEGGTFKAFLEGFIDSGNKVTVLQAINLALES